MSERLQTRVALAGDLGFSNLPAWLAQWQGVIQAHNEGRKIRLSVDLKNVSFVTPASAVSLAALLGLLRSTRAFEGEVEVIPPISAEVHQWMARLDFYELVNINTDYPFNRWSARGRFQEVVLVRNDRQGDEVSQDFGVILEAQTSLSSEVRSHMQTLFAEVLDNVFHHAQSPLGAVVCAQTYPQRRYIEFAIADVGRGIAASLADNPEHRAISAVPVEAIQLALKPGVTRRPSWNRGWGLSWLARAIEKNGGRLLIYSHDAVVQVGAVERVATSVPLWPGTIVTWQVSMDRPLQLKEVMDEFDPPDSSLDDLFG